MQPGDIISNGNHVEMFLYKNGNGDYQQYGFNAGDTDPIYASVDLADRIIQYVSEKGLNISNSSMPSILSSVKSSDDAKVCWEKPSGEPDIIRVVRYIGNNIDIDDKYITHESSSGETHGGSHGGFGRGRGNNSNYKSNSSKNKPTSHYPISKKLYKQQEENTRSGKGKNDRKYYNQKINEIFGNNLNTSYNRSNTKKYNNQPNTTTSHTSSKSNNRSINNIYSQSSYNESGYGIGSNISTKINQLNLSNDQLISILEVIADNSNKTDQIIQLLAAIVTNTSSTNNTQSNSTNKINQLISQLRSNNSSSAPIAGLNNILNNNSENTAKAVYSIAKS